MKGLTPEQLTSMGATPDMQVHPSANLPPPPKGVKGISFQELTKQGAKPDSPEMSVDKNAALLGLTTSAHDRLAQAKATSEAAEKSAILNSTEGTVANTITGLPKATLDVGKEILDQAGRFVGSAVRSPVDIVRGLFGKGGILGINNSLFGSSPLSGSLGKDSKGKDIYSYQSETPDITSKVFEGDMTPLEGTAASVLPVVEGAGATLGLEQGVSTILNKTPKLAGAYTKFLDKGGVNPYVANEGESFARNISEAKKILNPSSKFSPTEAEQLRASGQVQTKGMGPFKKDIPNPKTTSQHETLASMINEGKISTKNTPQQNIQALSEEARKFDSNIDELVNRPELNKPYQTTSLNKTIDSIKSGAKKDLTFVSDSVEEKAYNDVLNVYREEITKQPLNSSGLRTGIKNANARMDRVLGKDVYSGANESVGNAKIQAAKDARSGFNNMLADNLESPTIKKTLTGEKVVNTMPSSSEYSTGRLKGGDVYRAQLQKEAQILNAKDEIAYRSRGTLNKSQVAQKAAQYAKNHPVKTAAATALSGAIGTEGIRKITTGHF